MGLGCNGAHRDLSFQRRRFFHITAIARNNREVSLARTQKSPRMKESSRVGCASHRSLSAFISGFTKVIAV
jgi:hypothetical protein